MAGTKKLFDRDGILVVAPQTHEAMRYWGGGTKWCIATSNESHWNSYFSDNSIIVILVKGNGKPEKIAITVPQGRSNTVSEWSIYSADDAIQQSSYLENILGDHAGDVYEAIENFSESDTDRIDSTRQDLEYKKAEESFDYHDYENLLSHLYEISVKDVKQAIALSGMSAEEARDFFFRIHLDLIRDGHGTDSVNSIEKIQHFWNYADDADAEAGAKLKDSLEKTSKSILAPLEDELGMSYREIVRRLGGEGEVVKRVKDAVRTHAERRKGEPRSPKTYRDLMAIILTH